MAKDPVCGMRVDEKTATNKSVYQGKAIYFCSESCKTTFDQKPDAYAGGASVEKESK